MEMGRVQSCYQKTTSKGLPGRSLWVTRSLSITHFGRARHQELSVRYHHGENVRILRGQRFHMA